ncbi:hypothetical protein H7J88_19300 [Mycolicibacterium flavescens]|uniref:Cullin, a subunit of E3 ubiquitin ligase n=1 Tax=Mycolicibacterium flavescens TaxID=1776 RepID=A0A1E3RLT3_MYCFV|nr:hypothetical protein [Mycolicibacterium flavescens]MCV7281779.1 hypothetical protein [Mycolicibacterium flavescens]ODQ90831.1 hypothetical protein BHQ18_08920 [Mycolicibacterium flavescens]
MWQPFLGPEAIADGRLTRGQLRWNNTAILPRVYAPNDAKPTVYTNAVAAWLHTGRKGIIAGRVAASLHGAKWVDASTPVEIITTHTRRRSGIIVHEERIADDEITHVNGLPVTAVARTALDLGRHLPRGAAVAHLDALSRATGVTADDALSLIDRYRGARGVRRARTALDLMDGGAQSHEETRVRLILIDAGLPRPRTQIRVSDGRDEAFLDMGYDEPMVGLDYDGLHHSEDRRQYVYDIGRDAFVERQGWIDIHVVKEHSRAYILHRVYEAFARRGWNPPKSARGS